MYQTIARKWRPQTFKDLVGQEPVVQTLKNAVTLKRLGHAYLFSGARGIGKTTVARIFAKLLRCEKVVNGEPCNQCQECLQITEGRSVDVIEIDGASHNGVESVRAIRESVAYGAANGFYKIYIIDEVHMLSVSAFNALLKTLEEPPSHVIFIFATTEIHKIPLTILSRCQRFEFRRLKNSQVVERLKEVLKAEGVGYEEETLHLLASHSDGSLRDALSLLDQALSFAGESKQLKTDEAVEALGVTESQVVLDYVLDLLSEDIFSALKKVEDVHTSGMNLKHFSEKVLEQIRLVYLLVVSKSRGLTAEDLDVSPLHFEKIKTAAGKASLLQVERISQILNKAIQQLDWSSLPQYVLEMASVRICKLKDLEKIEQVLMGQAEAPVVEAPAVPKPVTAAAPTPQAPAPSAVAASVPPKAPPTAWEKFIDALMKKRPLLGALLSHADFRIDGKNVHLVFAKDSFYERQALESKNRQDIQDQLKAFFGPETVLVLSSGAKEVAPSLETTKREEEERLKQEAIAHPVVQQMKEALGAEVVGVKINNEYHAT